MKNKVAYSVLREYLKKSVPKKYVRSLFIAGSAKEELPPGSDVDTFFVAYKETLNEFLNDLTSKLKSFVKRNPSFMYTYFRGPIKFENKILIHCVIYTNGKGPGKIEDFQNEPPQVFEGILKKYDVILGDNPIKIKPEMDLGKKPHKEREEYMKRKANEFWNRNSVTYREWKKTKDKWAFEIKTIKLSPWQKEHLEKYFRDYKP
ncbi:MAG: hypothetical protein ABIH49_01685 [archaeon]